MVGSSGGIGSSGTLLAEPTSIAAAKASPTRKGWRKELNGERERQMAAMTEQEKWDADVDRARALAEARAAPPPLRSSRFEGKGGRIGQKKGGGLFAPEASRAGVGLHRQENQVSYQ